jgi:hypothetical protein
VAAFHKDGQVDLNTDPETPAGQLIDSQTAAITEKDTELLYLCDQFDPAKNEGIFQDAIAKIYFLSRKAATPSTAKIRSARVIRNRDPGECAGYEHRG